MSAAAVPSVTSTQHLSQRAAWVDRAKGICIILVVMLHSAMAVEEVIGTEGFVHYIVVFARPFRMPAFFLISGLFLSRVVYTSWRKYANRKVLYFAYFYVLWLSLHFLFKLPTEGVREGLTATFEDYLFAFVQPFGTLWFIYILPVFFVIAKLTARWHPVVTGALALLAALVPLNTGWIVADHTAARFIYFYLGYQLAPAIFRLAAWARWRKMLAIISILVWAGFNAFLAFSMLAVDPLITVVLGLTGAAALVIIAAVVGKGMVADAIRYCGRRSIVIYLAFVFPVHGFLMFVQPMRLMYHAGVIVLMATAAGIVGALSFYQVVKRTRWAFLFERPQQLDWKAETPKLSVAPEARACTADVATTVPMNDNPRMTGS